MKLAKDELLDGVKRKSVIVLSTSLRPDSAMKGGDTYLIQLYSFIHSFNTQWLTYHLSIAKDDGFQLSPLNGGYNVQTVAMYSWSDDVSDGCTIYTLKIYSALCLLYLENPVQAE